MPRLYCNMRDNRNKADALAFLSGIIKNTHENNENISTEALIEKYNLALDEYDVESETLHIEA